MEGRQGDRDAEELRRLGGTQTTTYRYTKVWSGQQIDSKRFKAAAGHANPQMRYRDLRVAAKDGTIGAFRPSETVLRNLAVNESMPLDTQMADAIAQKLGRKVQIVSGEIYLGDNPDSPAIGDLRISYKLANPSVISIVGRQAGTDFCALPDQGRRRAAVRKGRQCRRCSDLQGGAG